jgi:ParB family chromosome partitioning protein
MNRKELVKLPEQYELTTEKPVLRPGQPWIGYVEPRHIKPNPNQPRETFPDEDQAALRGSHTEIGQVRPVSVIPFTDPSNSEIWFMIHDGERSWRSLRDLDCEAVLVSYNPLINEDNLDVGSFVANFGGKGHTHKETIRAVWKHVKEDGIEPQEFAKMVTKHFTWVYNYVRLHNLHPDLQELMDPPTPKNARLPMRLALTLCKADRKDQLDIYMGIKDMSAKKAVNVAKEKIGKKVVVGRQPRPSDYLKVLNRILKTVPEDLSTIISFPEEVLSRAAYDREMTLAVMESIMSQCEQITAKIKGEKWDPSQNGNKPKVKKKKHDPLAAARIAAHRLGTRATAADYLKDVPGSASSRR